MNPLRMTKRARILHASLGTLSSTSFPVFGAPAPALSIGIHKPIYEKPPVTPSEFDFSMK